ncbi:hypothetical protein [Psychroflexus aurantiacus]|uniref:hypothetical protein n=1 Tax=Psychroflexus aurantiacus TaxID=2709310 RepID=UPI0019673896|nr:hypothetical protein [Psychroflexus aurantiacus]
MKPGVFLVFSLIFCFIACKTQQKSTEEEGLNKISIANCPEDGTCSFEVLNQKSLVIKTDATGAQYPQVTKGKHKVLKFEYKRNQDPQIADDEYTEVVYAQIEPGQKKLDLNDDQLKQAKLLFGRLCFCKGQAGYFPVREGHFKVSSNKDESITYSFNIELTDVPHVLTEVSVTHSHKK